MMKAIVWIGLLFISIVQSGGAEAKDGPKYPVSAIPADLIKDVDVVQRLSQTTFTILGPNRTHAIQTRVFTIFNQKGKEYAMLGIPYSLKLDKVVSIRGVVYDAMGYVVRKLKSNEVYDQASHDGFTMFSDNRVKYANLSHGVYPYTVEYEYEIEAKYLYSVPSFSVDESVGTELMSYSVKYPVNLKPTYKLFNGIKTPEMSSTESTETLTWEYKNVKPTEDEPFSNDADELPFVLFNTGTIEYDGYSGKIDSWDNMGKWQVQLNQGRNILPDNIKTKVKELTAGLKTDYEKIGVLYNYLQNTTRYVGIQRGIGGMQPFDAKLVAQVGYGDCKALSNYMVALLKEAGITGHYTQIYAGTDPRPILNDFPYDYFNHIIVCVPTTMDTVWLECTSQTQPMGFLGSSTCNRKALMITDTGGELVRTPVYAYEQNAQNSTGIVELKADGDAVATLVTSFSGLNYEYGGLSAYANSSPDDQRKWLQKHLQIPTYDLVKYSMVNQKDRIPKVIVSVDVRMAKFASVTGKRIFVTPNVTNRWNYIPEKSTDRKSNVTIKTGFTESDTIQFSLPAEIHPEYVPAPVKLETRFGTYNASYSFSDGKFIYIRSLVVKNGGYPKDSYPELIEFFKKVNKADNSKIVFLNKT